MDKFSAYRVFEQDGKSAGRFVELTLDDLDPGEVVIQAHYSSVNYKDALAATGAGKVIRRFPCVGGIDVSGVVASSSDARFKAGDAVLVTGYDMGVAHDGGYAEYVRVPAGWVVPLPQGLSLFDAMALGTAGFTAALSIHRLEQNELRPENGKVIVTGATGGVSSLAIQMLSRLGYHVVALTGKEGAHDYLKSLGAAEILFRKDVAMGTRPLEKALWAGALDSVGGETLGVADSHDAAERSDRKFWQRGRCRIDYHRAAVHPARRVPARHRFGRHGHAGAQPDMASSF